MTYYAAYIANARASQAAQYAMSHPDVTYQQAANMYRADPGLTYNKYQSLMLSKQGKEYVGSPQSNAEAKYLEPIPGRHGETRYVYGPRGESTVVPENAVMGKQTRESNVDVASANDSILRQYSKKVAAQEAEYATQRYNELKRSEVQQASKDVGSYKLEASKSSLSVMPTIPVTHYGEETVSGMKTVNEIDLSKTPFYIPARVNSTETISLLPKMDLSKAQLYTDVKPSYSSYSLMPGSKVDVPEFRKMIDTSPVNVFLTSTSSSFVGGFLDASFIGKGMTLRVPFTETLKSNIDIAAHPVEAVTQVVTHPVETAGQLAGSVLFFETGPRLITTVFKPIEVAVQNRRLETQTNWWKEKGSYEYKNQIIPPKQQAELFLGIYESEIDLVSPQRTLTGERIRDVVVKEARVKAGIQEPMFKTPVYDAAGKLTHYEFIERNTLKSGLPQKTGEVQKQVVTQIPMAGRLSDKQVFTVGQGGMVDTGEFIGGVKPLPQEFTFKTISSSEPYGIQAPLSNKQRLALAHLNAGEFSEVFKNVDTQTKLPVPSETKASSNPPDVKFGKQRWYKSPTPYITVKVEADLAKSSFNVMSDLERNRNGPFGTKLVNELDKVDPYELSGDRLRNYHLPVDEKPTYVKVIEGRSRSTDPASTSDFGHAFIPNVHVTERYGTGTITGPFIISSVDQESKVSLGNLAENKQATSNLGILDQAAFRVVVGDNVIQTPKQRQKQILNQVQETSQVAIQEQKQVQESVLKFPSGESLESIGSDNNNPNPEDPIKRFKFQLRTDLKKKKKKYLTQVRRSGVFRTVGISEEEKGAFGLGSRIVSNTAAASFRVIEEGVGVVKPSGFSLNNVFTTSKADSNVVVQRRSFRISSSGEKLEIPGKANFVNKLFGKSRKGFGG